MTPAAIADRRPSFEFERDTAERFDHSLFVPGTYERPGKPYRLRVLYEEDHGLTDIIDEATTSESATAEGFADEGLCITLTHEQVRWLHQQLGALIARWNEGGLK